MQKNMEVWKSIFNTSSTILLVMLNVVLLINGINALEFILDLSFIDNEAVQYLLELALNAVTTISLYMLVYFATQFFWILNNKDKYFKGEWLHIHGRANGNVRVGRVDIKQSFYSLDVTAFNITPAGLPQHDVTNWSYIDSEIQPPALGKSVILFGCFASRRSAESRRQGIHTFDVVEMANGYPVKLKGNFRNCFNYNAHVVEDVNDESGVIIFNRMTKPLRKYLYPDGRFSNERLRDILKNEDLQNEEFVQDLRDILHRYCPEALSNR